MSDKFDAQAWLKDYFPSALMEKFEHPPDAKYIVERSILIAERAYAAGQAATAVGQLSDCICCYGDTAAHATVIHHCTFCERSEAAKELDKKN